MGVREPIAVDAANAAQLDAWDGPEGAYWADHADHFDRSVAAHHVELMRAAAVGATDRVLDLGCGTGATTLDAARRAPRGSAVGVDLSTRMLEVARRRAAAQDVGNATFLQADAQIHPFETAVFDLAISRTGAMFFGDPVAAFTNIGRALAPGGGLALVTWQGLEGNEWLREIPRSLAAGRDLPVPTADGPGPFGLSDPDRVRSILTAAGFEGVALTGFEAPMWFGHDADDAHRFVLGLMGWMLEGLDESARERALDDLRVVLDAHATAAGVVFRSAAWTITATRP